MGDFVDNCDFIAIHAKGIVDDIKQDLCEEDDDGENEADLDDTERDVLALFTFLPIGPGGE